MEESGTADRLIFFSDAVVAIAITLLALDLPVPVGVTASEFWRSARHNSGEYLAFLISFVVIAVTWGHHHSVFRYAARTDARFRTYNMAWLLTIVLNPFATRMLATEGRDSLATGALRFGFYAVLQVLSGLAFLAMTHRMVSRHLQAPDTPPNLVSQVDWETGALILSFGASIPLFFVTRYAWLLWIFVPPLLGQIRRRRAR